MTRSMRKRLQRLLEAKPPLIRRGEPQQELVDTLYANQYRQTLEILAGLSGDNAADLATTLSRSLHHGGQAISRGSPQSPLSTGL